MRAIDGNTLERESATLTSSNSPGSALLEFG
jgi:hypothetical protein